MKDQMIQLENLVNILRQSLPELEQRYRVNTLGLFGSYLYGEQHKRSGLDLLVEFTVCEGFHKGTPCIRNKEARECPW
jgi:uncharacterized protein